MANETQEKILNTVIVLRHDTKETWETNDAYVLREGEVGIGYMTVEERDADGKLKENTVAKYVPIIKVGTKDSEGELISWKELPQAEGVFEEDLTLTYNFGRYTTSNGYVVAQNKGMTTSEWLKYALSKVTNPKTNYPTASISAVKVATDSGTNEIGSYVTKVKFTTSTGNGSYVDPANANNTFGSVFGSSKFTNNATGVGSANFSFAVTNNYANQQATANTELTLNKVNDKLPQIYSTESKTYTSFTGTCTFDASKTSIRTPLNNCGQEYAAGKINGFDAAGTTSKNVSADVKITGFRNSWYYVGTELFDITADNIRSKGTQMKTASPNFNIASKTAAGTTGTCMPIPQGTKRIMFVVPGSKNTISGIDIDGMQLPYDGFTKQTIRIKGYNNFVSESAKAVTDSSATENKDGYLYTIFVKENAEGLAATGYTITIA